MEEWLKHAKEIILSLYVTLWEREFSNIENVARYSTTSANFSVQLVKLTSSSKMRADRVDCAKQVFAPDVTNGKKLDVILYFLKII
jgi:hypothetical protein